MSRVEYAKRLICHSNICKEAYMLCNLWDASSHQNK